MQIVKIESWNRDFYCPVTGKNLMELYGEGLKEVNSFKGQWVDVDLEMPTVKCRELGDAWEARYRSDIMEDEEERYEDEVLESFLREYDQPNWVAFEITTHAIACGPVCSVVWFVLDLGNLSEASCF